VLRRVAANGQIEKSLSSVFPTGFFDYNAHPPAPRQEAYLMPKSITPHVLFALLFAVVALTILNAPRLTEPLPLPALHPPPPNTLFNRLLMPFVDEAQNRRQTRSRTDPGYLTRVDPELAADRINFLLFGYGETYEPPFKSEIIGAYTIVSFDTRTGKADLIALTHDLRAPEIERVLEDTGHQVGAVKIDQAYDVGSFDLMRRTVEDATGLPIDFQISFRDVLIKKLVDEVFGQVEVQVPEEFYAAPFYLDGEWYQGAHFIRGNQWMNGTRVIQFIKTLESGNVQSFQRNSRKELVLAALLDAVTAQCADRALWVKLSGLVLQERLSGDVAYDFDPVALLAGNLGRLASGLQASPPDRACGFGGPRIDRSTYIVDPQSGDGGVRWVQSDATVNAVTQKDIAAGVYGAGGLGVAVPLDGNPYGDLVADYWPSVRVLVKQTILGSVP
jgi:LytR_cpsA_psr family